MGLFSNTRSPKYIAAIHAHLVVPRAMKDWCAIWYLRPYAHISTYVRNTQGTKNPVCQKRRWRRRWKFDARWWTSVLLASHMWLRAARTASSTVPRARVCAASRKELDTARPGDIVHLFLFHISQGSKPDKYPARMEIPIVNPIE